MNRAAIDRFIDRMTIVDFGCWLWNGAVRTWNYGLFNDGHKLCKAHRWSYEFYRGPIPAKFDLDHLCQNPPCVNPLHLEPVTHAENIRRIHTRPGHCAKGHATPSFNRFGYCNSCRQEWPPTHAVLDGTAVLWRPNW